MSRVCACAVRDTSVLHRWGIFLFISYRGNLPIYPDSFCHSSAGQRVYCGTSNPYAWVTTMDLLCRKQRNWISKMSWKSACMNRKTNMTESIKNRTKCKVPKQRGHFLSQFSVWWLHLFFSFVLKLLCWFSFKGTSSRPPDSLHHLLRLHWAVEDGSLVVWEFPKFNLGILWCT